MTSRPQYDGNLWTLIAGPTLWALHFLVCYWIAATYCAKAGRDALLEPVRPAILIISAVALASLGALGAIAYRRHRRGRSSAVPHDGDTPLDRHRFLGFATLLLAALSATAVVYTTVVVLVFEGCR